MRTKPEAIYQEIGKRIAMAREQCDMNQTELAEFIGLTRASVSNIEAGKQRIHIHTLFDIALCLEVDAFSLIPQDGTEKERVDALRQINSQIEALRRQALQIRERKNGGDQ